MGIGRRAVSCSSLTEEWRCEIMQAAKGGFGAGYHALVGERDDKAQILLVKICEEIQVSLACCPPLLG